MRGLVEVVFLDESKAVEITHKFNSMAHENITKCNHTNMSHNKCNPCLFFHILKWQFNFVLNSFIYLYYKVFNISLKHVN
jgi:hypothetical protein